MTGSPAIAPLGAAPATPWRRLRARVTALLPPIPVLSADDRAAFDAHRRDQDFRNWRLFCIFSAVCTLVWWPSDLVLLRAFPAAIQHVGNARGMAAATTIAMVIAVRFVPFMRRHALVLFGLGATAVFFYAGLEFGHVGGPGQPWFHFGYFTVLPPIGVSLTLWKRVGVTLVFALAYALGFFAMHPANLADPLAGASINYLCFAVVFAIVAGVVTDRLRLRTFALWRTSKRQADELRVLKADLEQRVDARTREVRLLLSHLESAREAERGRLARELHDELGQELTALRYAVELTRRRHAVDPAGIAANLADIEGLLQRARLVTREVVAELRPRVLDDLGLPAAAELLARRSAEHSGLDIRLTSAPDLPTLDADVATAGYRILQECLTNVARHAAAKRVDVSLGLDGDALVLRVVDDGVGFDPSATTGGFGLLGMRERAAALGFVVRIDSAPGRGARVEARLPLAGRASPAPAEVAA